MRINVAQPSIQPHIGRLYKVWSNLTKTAETLQGNDARQAQLLVGSLLILFPLGFFATFLNTFVNLLQGKVWLPATSSILAMLLVFLAYIISRTKYYKAAVWLVIVAVAGAILGPIFTGASPAAEAGYYFLTLSVVVSGLLLTSVNTAFIGGILCALLLVAPVPDTTTTNANAVSLMLIITVITGIVGWYRDYYVKLLEETQQELKILNNALEQKVSERTVDLKEARNEALASQRIAQENSRLKSEFLSMMSHELRTPMNAIEGFTGIILKRMAGTDFNEKTERYLLKIQSNSSRLLGLINDFLDLSRIESGRMELAHLPMSATQMAQQWKDNLSVLAHNKKLSLDVIVDPNLPHIMYGDEESISKIAINLVGNAVKFTEQGSVTLTLQRCGEKMALEVRDTGIGIPPHAREYIFDEFRQVDQSSKRVYGGTGLGLSIVQKLAFAMGGTVTLQSEVGVGSTFTVLLPIDEQQKLVEGVS